MKLFVIFGSRMGFRGGTEHSELQMSQIGSGYYPDDHPLFPGLEWWGIVDWGIFKTHHLDTDTDYVFQDEDYVMRFPVISDGVDDGDVANDAGGAIKRWVEKVLKAEAVNKSPDLQKTRFYRRCNSHKIFVNQHIGLGQVNKKMHYAYKIMGLPN